MKATEQRGEERSATGNQLKGTLQEACSCGVLCPLLDRRGSDGGECPSFAR